MLTVRQTADGGRGTREQDFQQMGGGERRRIKGDGPDRFQRASMREKDAIDRSIAGDGHALGQRVVRLAERLENRYERNIEFPGGNVPREA